MFTDLPTADTVKIDEDAPTAPFLEFVYAEKHMTFDPSEAFNDWSSAGRCWPLLTSMPCLSCWSAAGKSSCSKSPRRICQKYTPWQ